MFRPSVNLSSIHVITKQYPTTIRQGVNITQVENIAKHNIRIYTNGSIDSSTGTVGIGKFIEMRLINLRYR